VKLIATRSGGPRLAESSQALAARAARELRRALRLDLFVLVFLVVALVLLLAANTPAWTRFGATVALAAGLAALVYSLRLRIDAAAFERWAASEDIDAEMLAFDERLRRRFPSRAKGPRPLEERIAGAMRLRRIRSWWCSLQGLAILAAEIHLRMLAAGH
jgi:hypothetical protein